VKGLGVMRSIARDFHAARQNCLASFGAWRCGGFLAPKPIRISAVCLITNAD